MTFERALREVGDFGRYQHFFLLFIFWTTFTCGLNYYTQLFLFSLPPHECVASGNKNDSGGGGRERYVSLYNKLMDLGNASDSILKRMDIDKSCHEYFVPSSFPESLSSRFAIIDNETDNALISQHLDKRPCSGEWEYDHSEVFVTIASEKNWVCDKDHRPAVLNQAFWIGNVVGCFIWGLSNDRLGRRPTVIMSHLIYFLGDVMTYLAPEYWSILACRFIVGISHHTVSHLPYLLAVEYVGVGSRTAPLLSMMFAYCFASLAVPFVARALTGWRTLLAVAAAPVLAVPLLAFRLLPESPSWLLCKGRVEQAKTELARVARVNGRDTKEVLENLDVELKNEMNSRRKAEEESKAERGKGCCQYPRLVWHAVIAVALCVVGFMCYYGHVENTSNLGHNLYWSFFFGALVEIPAYSVYYLVNRFGRKPVLVFCAVGSGIASIGYGYLPTDFTVVRLCDALAGRMFAVGIYYVALQFSLEVLPTVVRGTGAAVCEIFGGLGVFLCPQIVYLGRESPWLPLLVFGSLSFFGGAIVLLLPESRGRELPQTLQDGNEFGREKRGTER